ncbi:threonine aldolase family protein [Tannockella kyphosi]|uniref:threonine aldolase family protein n=1 Tax=Tannockella kyphosi TaxID=2899121 RepID=UPI0020122B3D|nr:aminotransferase class V-fold PLP-dependent enzyme [Tannockella kyphosi]
MYSFTNDYSEGAHPRILEALVQTNNQQTAGYGTDQYCKAASDKLKELIDKQDVDVHFIPGGTHTNLILISSALKAHQAVMAVDSGHIFVHETGAIEATGHKVLTRPHNNGKLSLEMIESMMAEHTDEHMVQPKMVYISQTTEFGTVYTLQEIKEISAYCKEHDLFFFIDGARLGSALVVEGAPSLKEMAMYSDAFYIGGTKMGALFGECLVLVNDELKKDFRYHIKQKGAMFAKGRLLGVQFLTLFNDDLYFEIGKYENNVAKILRDGLVNAGYSFYVDSPSNQLFPILPNQLIKKLESEFSFNIMDKIDENHTVIRLVTSFATPASKAHQFVELL